MRVVTLKQEEKILTKPLYEEAFPEDTPSLVSYYYQYKMADNDVYAATDGKEISGMLCLNPYRVSVRGKIYPLFYIVAVATKKEYRRKGIMRAVLTQALCDQAKKGLPFTYLKPANQAYYTPFDFVFISDRMHRRFRKDLLREEAYDENKGADVIVFTNQYLQKHFDVYALRDARYMQDLTAELKAGKGSISLLYERETLQGVWIRDYPDIQEENARLLFADSFLEKETAPPTKALMGRLLSLPAFAETAVLSPDCKKDSMVCYFSFSDALISENNGFWKWTLYHERSKLERVERAEIEEPIFNFNPAEFTAFMFGRHTAQKAVWQKDIKTLCKVYFDEET